MKRTFKNTFKNVMSANSKRFFTNFDKRSLQIVQNESKNKNLKIF